MLKESTYQTPCGTIHYWSSILSLDTTTLVFLPGLTADHRLFDKQVEHFVEKYNIIAVSYTHLDVYKRQVWECRNCGHIVVGTKAPEVCPVCNHPQSYFEVHAENY